MLGDIVLIPVGSERFAVGKILYVSRIYSNVILLGIYNIAVTTQAMPSLYEANISLIYTSKDIIEQGRWTLVGNDPLKPNEHGLAIRIVGGDVWLDDECIRTANSEDIRNLPRMQVLGAGLVEAKAAQLVTHPNV